MIRRIICKNNIINKNVRHVVKKYNVASKTTTTLFNKKRIMGHNNNNLNLLRNFGTSNDEVKYKHPLSELVFDEIVTSKPEWFHKDKIEWNTSDGTFKLPFIINEENGLIATFYDLDTKTHYLGLQFSGLVGKVSLTDNSKSAWQSNINDDRNRVIDSTKTMMVKIEEASNGILPSVDEEVQEDGENSSSNNSKDFNGPFPDSIAPVNG